MGVVLAGLVWLVAYQAMGVIKVEDPVSRIFGGSDHVYVGVVADLNAELKLATVRVESAQKGELRHGIMRVQVAKPDGLAAKVSAGLPVVVFLKSQANEGSVAVLHMADTWLLANGIPGAKPSAWRTAQIYEGTKAYPGRTAGLVEVVRAMRDGRQVLDDVIDPAGFAGKARQVATIGASPTFFCCADFNGDGRPDLLAGTAGGVRLLLWTQDGYADAGTASGLGGASGSNCAVGDLDGDGCPDLLMGSEVWMGGKGTFKKPDPGSGPDLPGGQWLAGSISDVDGNGKADVTLLYADGLLVSALNPAGSQKAWSVAKTNLWSPDASASAAVLGSQWSEDGQLSAMVVRGDGLFRHGVSPADRYVAGMERLAGVGMVACDGLKARPVKAIAATAWDSDGNRKPDFLVLTESGGAMLMNRGAGAFLVNNATHGKVAGFQVDGRPLKFSSGWCVAAGPGRPVKKWRQSLFAGAPDGRIFELE